MFSYYGSKSKVVQYYPAPKHDTIIEPFGGSGRYALRYWERNVILNDKYEVVARIWKFLQQCSAKDILSLPELKAGELIRQEDYDCEEMAWLMGFMAARARVRPTLKVSLWGETEIRRAKKRIAENLFKIKHWQITNSDYRDIDNTMATWFIDPPYRIGGHMYVHHIDKLDRVELAEFCHDRFGQKIVCENAGASWLDFRPLKEVHAFKGNFNEGFWTGERALTNRQYQLAM